MSTIKLYNHPLSGHGHRVALFLSLLGLDHETIFVDLSKGEHKQAEFLALNPKGQVPVLVDDGDVLTDSNSILIYLASRYAPDTNWMPQAPDQLAQLQRYFTYAATDLANGPARARLITLFGAPFDAETTIAAAHDYLQQIEKDLEGKRWLVGDTPTLADIAQYSYIARAPEGNVSLQNYPHILAWLNRVEGLSGFSEFVKSPVGLEQ